MSDEGPENLILRYLRSLDERQERLEASVTRGFEVVAARLAGIEGRFIGVEGRLSALESWAGDVTKRLDRIERRLGLVEVGV